MKQTKGSNDTIQVRKGEELDDKELNSFLQKHVKEVPDGALEIKQFKTGYSNLTYLIRINEWEAVLRRPPHGPLPPKAHDMEREYTFLSRLEPKFKTAPKPYIFSNDKSIVGSPFFIMERKKGIILDTDFPENISYSSDKGRRISELMVDKLVELHKVDSKESKLIELAKPEGFMNRQVKGWIERYNRAKTDNIKGIDELLNYLQNNIPTTTESTVIHYDYKVNNAMFSEDFTKMNGLFDWEMSTVGDPLVDLAVAMSYWIQDDDNELLKHVNGEPPVTIMEGFYSREEFINEYSKKSGRDVTLIGYYMTFAYFKLAVIGQQIYYRFKNGQTKDPRFSSLNILVKNMIQQASKSLPK